MGNYVLAYDVGTTGIKTCLIEIDFTFSPAEVRSKIRTNGGTQ